MPNLIQRLTSISAQSPRSGPPPGRRLLALLLSAMLGFGSTFPGFAAAGESDREGEGATPPIEVPVGPPDFDPGGEETGLEEETPAGEEEGATGTEAEVEVEAPAPEVTGAATEAPAEVAPPPPAPAPSPEPSSQPEPEPAPQRAAEPTEPVANQSLAAPKEKRVENSPAPEGPVSGEAAAPAVPVQQEAPQQPSPEPIVSTPADPSRSLAGKNTYVVQPGDCLWHIAAGMLSHHAGSDEIASEVARLWRLNEDRIGTGDPNLIYAGTELRLS